MARRCSPLRLLAVAALLAGPALAAPAAPDRVPLVLALIPQAPALEMHDRWTPLAARLSALAGVPIQLKLYDDMEVFERDFAAGVPDLLFAHPSMAAAAHRAQGYVPLVRDRAETSGLLLVRKDSPYRTITDLDGRQVAFAGARAFCTIITQDLMRAQAVDLDFRPILTGSTRNVLRAVALGKVDAGASLDFNLAAEPAELRDQLRVLGSTRRMAPHPLGAHPRVPAEVRERLIAAVLQMAAAPADRPLLARVRLADPVRADYERDYRALEQEAPASGRRR